MIRWLRRKPKTVGNYRVLDHPFAGLGEPVTADYRGVPTLECPCGSNLLLVCCVFDPDTNLPGLILLDSMCAHCGALLTVADPTLLEVE